MEEIPSKNMLVQRLKEAILPLDMPYSGLLPNSGVISTIGMSHKKKPDGLFPKDYSEMVMKWNFIDLFCVGGQIVKCLNLRH